MVLSFTSVLLLYVSMEKLSLCDKYYDINLKFMKLILKVCNKNNHKFYEHQDDLNADHVFHALLKRNLYFSVYFFI